MAKYRIADGINERAGQKLAWRAQKAMSVFRRDLKAKSGVVLVDSGETLSVVGPPKMTAAERKTIRKARKRLAKKNRRIANENERSREEAHLLRIAMGESMDENAPA